MKSAAELHQKSHKKQSNEHYCRARFAYYQIGVGSLRCVCNNPLFMALTKLASTNDIPHVANACTSK